MYDLYVKNNSSDVNSYEYVNPNKAGLFDTFFEKPQGRGQIDVPPLHPAQPF